MICRALEAPHPQIQELCLVHIPAFAALLDYTVVKNSILPRIKHLAVTSTAGSYDGILFVDDIIYVIGILDLNGRRKMVLKTGFFFHFKIHIVFFLQ